MQKTSSMKEGVANYPSALAADSQSHTIDLSGKPENFSSYLTVFETDLYRINDLNCYFDYRHTFKPDYTGNFAINFTRRGFFTFKTFRRQEEEYASRIMLEKPGCEFKFIMKEPGPGGCTIFNFNNEGYELIKERFPLQDISFFQNHNDFSTVISANAAADILHYRILSKVQTGNADPLDVDCLVTEMVNSVMHLMLGSKYAADLPASVKRYHLRTIERAKDYMIHHSAQEITLKDLARHCYVSQFHFTRLFKQFCGYSPIHYLQQIRLQNAETLLRKTDLPISDVCFQTGFKRLDYFSSVFTKQFGMSPSKYRYSKSIHTRCLRLDK